MPPRPLADLIDACLAPALAQQGFAGRQIVSLWPEIVGERLGQYSRPLKIDWPRRRNGPGEAAPDPATLVVRVEGAFALELQHLAPVIIERVNRHLGWRAIGKLVLKQGPVAQVAVTSAPRQAGPEAVARVDGQVGKVSDEGLRQALTRLGHAIATRKAD
jgi:hypothetical protein